MYYQNFENLIQKLKLETTSFMNDPYSRSRSVENVHELIRWAKHGKTDTVRRIGLKWKQEARKNSLRRFKQFMFLFLSK